MKLIDAVESCYSWEGSNVGSIEAASIEKLGTKGLFFFTARRGKWIYNSTHS